MGAVVVAFAIVAATSRVAGRKQFWPRPGSAIDQLIGAVRMAWRDWRRNPVFWVLLAVVPAVFILLADITTRHGSAGFVLTENGARVQGADRSRRRARRADGLARGRVPRDTGRTVHHPRRPAPVTRDSSWPACDLVWPSPVGSRSSCSPRWSAQLCRWRPPLS